jgi:FAD-NAD(P)-binding
MGPDGAPVEVVLVGAGPTASSLLERIVANVPELLGERPLTVHLVDPYPAGQGRVWRPDLPHLLWMNSMAEDVTIFTDESVRCAGPIRPGPTLLDWVRSVDDETLAAVTTPEVATEVRSVGPTTFPSRLVQSAYLEWFRRHVLASRPPNVEVVTHRNRAVDVRDEPDGTQTVWLDGAEPLHADAVVLALGHLDAAPRDGGATLAFAASHDLVHIAAGHTADQDLSVLEPGADVIALGFGQAFTDLVALVTEGRGGRFETAADGRVTYHPSGREPILHVGSRRGVPYRSKLEYRLLGPPAPMPKFLDETAIQRLLARPDPLQFPRDIYPLVAKEVGWSYYHELFVAHGERTGCDWDEFAERYAAACSDDELAAVVDACVPDPEDRFSIPDLDRPLAGRRFEGTGALHDHVAAHVVADVARRTNPDYSADLGAFLGLLWTFSTVGRIGLSGRVAPRSRVLDIGARWFSFFMYYASGPPPPRLRQLLALADAGLVHFIGAGTTVTADEERRRFVARSTSHDDIVVASAYVDARIPTASVSRTTDALLAGLHGRGDVTEEVISDGDGWSVNTGKVVVDHDNRIVRADGSPDARRFGVGVFTNRPAAGAFARPRTNAPAFRQHDAVARTLLKSLSRVVDERAARTVAP